MHKNKLPFKTHPPLPTKLSPTPQNPPLNLYPSNKHIYPQIIHHLKPVTLPQPSSQHKHIPNTSPSKLHLPTTLPQAIPKKPNHKPIKQILFHPRPYLYHPPLKPLPHPPTQNPLQF
ncbi:50S ribosomal protein L18 [Staphylococcus epidermidis]|uniref:50S ribosomal protein L18 n=1 Tax=Staphylococcus epidermidis TaxID=1282 RepID=UPI0037DA710C